MKKYRIKPYTIPAWVLPAIEILRPRERLPVATWAEKYRILPDTNAIPGPWRNTVTPYLGGRNLRHGEHAGKPH